MTRILASLLGACVLFCGSIGSASDNPNIVFILVDDMGYGDPGCYNSQSKIPTPNIDSLVRSRTIGSPCEATPRRDPRPPNASPTSSLGEKFGKKWILFCDGGHICARDPRLLNSVI